MTAELLERLYLEIRNKDTGTATQDKQSSTVLPKVCYAGYIIHTIFSLLSAASLPQYLRVYLNRLIQKH